MSKTNVFKQVYVHSLIRKRLELVSLIQFCLSCSCGRGPQEQQGKIPTQTRWDQAEMRRSHLLHSAALPLEDVPP